MKRICAFLIMSLHWTSIITQDPEVVQSCTKYKKDVFEEQVAFSHFFPNAPVEYETLDNCHGARPLIVGGMPAEGKEFPHMARLGHRRAADADGKTATDWFCGGTLISDRFVLTAAHCFYSIRGVVNIVRLGELDFDSDKDDADPEDFGVRSYKEHPNYDNSLLYDDIGLVELDEPVKFNYYKHPACLPYDDGSRHNTFIAIGWGHKALVGSDSNMLLKVKLNAYNNVCRYKIESSDELPRGFNATTQLCIGSSELKDTCTGDSGGPVLDYHKDYPCMYHVLGITSTGIGCGTPNIPGVYTRVHFYLDWIKREITNTSKN
ncbi:venom protease-like [Scaptodrosophila lebanonensis]|uniref:Venom protease-like n=1 Tax=Drosophila lebanonensis TaxID=7225 RepID=A0A6J2T2W7_DROLE|nr:venom protease-like [Scaptodrosophila lebanonensis]